MDLQFLIDNSMSPRFAEGLRERGIDAIHVRERGLAAASDSTILALALELNRVVIALDTDFGTLLALRRESKPSVVQFRTSRKSQGHLLPLFLANLQNFASDLRSGAVVVVEDARIRVRRLPIVF